MTRPGRALVLLLAVWLPGCIEDSGSGLEDTDAGPPAVTEGEPCRWAWASCVDEESVLWCAEGEWAVGSCAELCAAQAPGVSSGGCELELEASAPAQVCACEPPAQGCYPGQGRCEDGDTLAWCGEEWSWTLASCASVCGAESLASLGCDAIAEAAVCLCTNTGTPCAGEPAVCADASTLSACEGEVWVELDCAELCGGPAACTPAAPGGAACTCEA